jgi:hypothetical protein
LEFTNELLKYLYYNDYKIKDIEKYYPINDIVDLLGPIRNHVRENRYNDANFFFNIYGYFVDLQINIIN